MPVDPRPVLLDPASAPAWTALGNAFDAEGRAGEALMPYRAATHLEPETAAHHYNLARALRAAGWPEEADAAYRRALALRPAYAEALNNRANLRRGGGARTAAGYLRALALRPDWETAHGNLADLLEDLYDEGDAATAARFAALWRARHPDHPVARHTGAALAGEQTERRAPDGYVRQEFDRFADTFEETLAVLGYRAPALLAECVTRAGLGGDLDVLDAGCGTGLCAPFLRGAARRLVGVDLSPAMLDKARERQLYDELIEAELEEFLLRHPRSFDLAMAADVFCYFGDLDRVMAGMATALRPGGALFFSVEALAEGEEGYRLLPHGRYAHAEPYLRRVLAAHGLTLTERTKATVRLEGGQPVAAWFVSARRSSRLHRSAGKTPKKCNTP